jgi:hypothetical protein
MDVIIWAVEIMRGPASTVSPGTDNSAQRWVVYDSTGQLLLRSARNPVFEAARFLIKAGVDPDATLYLVPYGDKDTARWRLRVPLGEAADWTVKELVADGHARIVRLTTFGSRELQE